VTTVTIHNICWVFEENSRLSCERHQLRALEREAPVEEAREVDVHAVAAARVYHDVLACAAQAGSSGCHADVTARAEPHSRGTLRERRLRNCRSAHLPSCSRLHPHMGADGHGKDPNTEQLLLLRADTCRRQRSCKEAASAAKRFSS